MDDYIRREAAVQLAYGYCHDKDGREGPDDVVELWHDLQNIPATDVRPVVLCRDCVYDNKCFTQSFVESESIIPFNRDTFYCADGKRREGGADG